MPRKTRRDVLSTVGSAALIGGIATTAGAKPTKGSIRKLGHSLLSDPAGGYAEEDVRSDGKYAVVGSFTGPGGSFLVDISTPTDPREVHEVPTPSFQTRHADVKFDPRDGIYYRTLEGDELGVELVDYGFEMGSLEDPEVVRMDAGSTHNVFPHPEEPILYACNEGPDEDPGGGLDVWDVSEPSNPQRIRETGPQGDLHDVVVDPDRELAHLAYLGGSDELDAYVIMDVSDPAAPTEVGRFDYNEHPDYEEIGKEGFDNCHYADYDPERELAIVGDEIGLGVPGGKHVFDVGWGEGSPENPIPIGFTHSPNAEVMDGFDDLFDWTTHNHDVISKGNTTLLVDGGYHEGAWVADISDPTDPTPADRYETDDMANQADGPGFIDEPPMAWGADYNAQRDLVVTSDMFTGLYTFKVTPAAANNQGGHT